MTAFQCLRLVSVLGLALLLAAIASELWFDLRSPDAADPAGKSVEIRMRGRVTHVTPTEYYLNRGAYGLGGACVVVSVLGMWWPTRRK